MGTISPRVSAGGKLSLAMTAAVPVRFPPVAVQGIQDRLAYLGPLVRLSHMSEHETFLELQEQSQYVYENKGTAL